MRNIILSLLSVVVASTFFIGCDDYIRTGIEGQWQMTEYIDANGNALEVDSVFYNFHKGVFKYNILLDENEISTFTGFGMYEENDHLISIKINEHAYYPYDEESISTYGWGEEVRREFIINRSSTSMELERNGEIFKFRKY